MLSMNSYSKAIIKDTFKRCWTLPVMALMMMVLTIMMPMISNYRQFNHVAVSAAELVKGSSFMMNFTLVSLAIMASYMAFEYLHEQTSSNAMHSLPLNRSRLFRTAYISGWIMTVAPTIIFALLLMSLRGATSKNAGPATADFDNLFGSEAMSAKEIFTLPHMFEFIITSVVVATMAYATACLAGVLSGRKGIHGILAIFLFLSPVGLVLLLETTCGRFLVGYDGVNFDYTYLNVCAYAMAKDGFGFDVMILIYYIAIAALLTVASLLIYKRIKLERIGNSTTFPVVGDILAIILAAISTLVFAHIFTIFSFDSSADESVMFALISLAASTVMYAAMRMTADNSYKIFTKRNFIQYGIFLVVMAIIMAFAVFDITGYGRRIPSAEQIKSVSCQTVFPQTMPQLDDNVDRRSDNPELIKDVINLHETIVNDEDMQSGVNNIWSEEDDLAASCDISIVWELKNGKELRRTYELRIDGSDSEYALRKLYQNKAYREQFREDVNTIFAMAKEVSVNDVDSEHATTIKKEDWKDIQEALGQDIESRSFDQLTKVSSGDSYIDIESAKKGAFGFNEVYTYWISEADDKNIFKVLKDKGYKK